MIRRSFLSACVGAIIAPWNAIRLAVPAEPITKIMFWVGSRRHYTDWPEGNGNIEYDLMNPRLFNMDPDAIGWTIVTEDSQCKSPQAT